MATRQSLSRSEQMSRIRGRDTRPEIVLRRELWARGARYRLQRRIGRVRPDLVFPGPGVVVFVDGCFWHGCPEHYVPPRTRRDFWGAKLATNVDRDRRQTEALETEGWTVLRYWEHEVFDQSKDIAERILSVLGGDFVRPRADARVREVEFLDLDGVQEKRHLVPLRGDRHLGFEVRERQTTKWKSRR